MINWEAERELSSSEQFNHSIFSVNDIKGDGLAFVHSVCSDNSKSLIVSILDQWSAESLILSIKIDDVEMFEVIRTLDDVDERIVLFVLNVILLMITYQLNNVDLSLSVLNELETIITFECDETLQIFNEHLDIENVFDEVEEWTLFVKNQLSLWSFKDLEF